MILYVVSNFNVERTTRTGTVGTTSAPGLSGLFTRGPFAAVNTSNLSINLPSNRVNGDRINRAGVNTNEIICRVLIGVSGSVISNSFFRVPTLGDTIRGYGGRGSTLRLVNLMSSNNMRDRVRRLCNLLTLTGGGGVRGMCIRYLVSNESISAASNINFVGSLRGRVTRVNINGVTAVTKHCCTVSHSFT